MATPNLGLKNDWTTNDLISASGWLTPISNAVDLAARAAHGTKSVAGAVDVTLSTSEADKTSLELTGAITANINTILPLTAGRFWWIYRNTTGAFTVTIKGATGTGPIINQGARVLVICDGTNFYAPFVTGQTYAASNVTTDRTYDADATSTAELADILGTLLQDLRAVGIVR